jgi:hypothetical protein
MPKATWGKWVTDSLLRYGRLADPTGGRMATGGSSSTVIAPLTIVSSRPRHIAAPATGVGEGSRRYWVTMGNINGIRLSNFENPIDLPLGSSRWIVAQCNLSSANSLTLTGCQIVVGSTETEYTTPDWPNNGSRPSTAFKLLATWHEDILSNAGAGNLQLTEVVSDIRMGSSMGESLLIKQFFWTRENYG